MVHQHLCEFPLVSIWVAYLFLDAGLVSRAAVMDPRELVNIWIRAVVQLDLPRLGAERPRLDFGPSPVRGDLLTAAGVTSSTKDSLLALCPPWPTITGGSPRKHS